MQAEAMISATFGDASDLVIVKDFGIGEDASRISSSALSGFTAVNQQPFQTLTPHSSGDAPILQNEGRRRSHGPSKRTRNPTVAQYLGLGINREPVHLEKYAPVSDIPKLSAPRYGNRRQRKAAEEEQISLCKRRKTRRASTADHGAVTDIYRVTKARNDNTVKAVGVCPGHEQMLTPPHTQHDEADLTCQQLDDDYDFDEGIFDSDFIDEDLLPLSLDATEADHTQCALDHLTATTDEVFHTIFNSDTDDVLQQQTPASIKGATKSFVTPVTRTTRLLTSASGQPSEDRKPIVRLPFPDEARDRSPIIGLTSNTILRTCFRIGEALNQAHQAAKTNKNMIFELYARILESGRDDSQQTFTFCDLFHTRAPYLKAGYSRSQWKSVPLFEYDSKRLLSPEKICRCIGKIVREGEELVMTVLNIWEATWDDILWVVGVLES